MLTVLQQQPSGNDTKLTDSQQDHQQSEHNFSQTQENSSSKQDTSQKSLFSKDHKRIAHTTSQSSSHPGTCNKSDVV